MGKNEWISHNLVTWMGGGIYSIRYSGMVEIIDCGWNDVILLRITYYYRLNFKCTETSGKLIDCTEEYTSKTCTGCGNMYDIGMSETYKCQDWQRC